MFISTNYKLAAGATPEDGMEVIKCSICQEEFAVPTNVKAELPEGASCDTPACMEQKAKLDAAVASVDQAATDEAADVVSKAVGG